MPVNLTTPRPDIVYLRRRLKKGGNTAPASAQTTKIDLTRNRKPNNQQVTKANTSSGARTSTLDLSHNQQQGTTTPPTISSSTPTAVEEGIVRSTIPKVVGLQYLKKENDAYQLTKPQSAIGSLVIENAMVAGWQMSNDASGYIYNRSVTPTEGPETLLPSYKKRPLIEFHKGLLVFGLRNLNQLKRLIVVPQVGETLQAEITSGTGVIMEYVPFTVLYISVVDSKLEFRKESFRDTITSTYGLNTLKV